MTKWSDAWSFACSPWRCRTSRWKSRPPAGSRLSRTKAPVWRCVSPSWGKRRTADHPRTVRNPPDTADIRRGPPSSSGSSAPANNNIMLHKRPRSITLKKIAHSRAEKEILTLSIVFMFYANRESVFSASMRPSISSYWLQQQKTREQFKFDVWHGCYSSTHITHPLKKPFYWTRI